MGCNGARSLSQAGVSTRPHPIRPRLSKENARNAALRLLVVALHLTDLFADEGLGHLGNDFPGDLLYATHDLLDD
jgi:hypothetical protein